MNYTKLVKLLTDFYAELEIEHSPDRHRHGRSRGMVFSESINFSNLYQVH